jgi:hypothetical protein
MNLDDLLRCGFATPESGAISDVRSIRGRDERFALCSPSDMLAACGQGRL